jgi:hypothetical protein
MTVLILSLLAVVSAVGAPSSSNQKRGTQSATHQRVHGSHARRGREVHDGHQNEDEHSADGNTDRW